MAASSQEDNQCSLAAFFTYLRGIPKEQDNQSGTEYIIREGAEKDKENFEEIFWNILDFKPFTGKEGDSSIENLTLDLWKHQDGREKCEKCWVCKIKAKNFSKCKYVALGFSSHGREEIADGVHQPVILLSDGEMLPLSDILKVLTVESNPTLADKPRIVILLACRAITKEADRFEVQMPQDSNVLKDDAEDEGAEIYVEAGEQEQQSPATGSDAGDPPLPLPKRKKNFVVTPVSEKEDEHYSAEKIPNNFLVVYGANRGRMNKRNIERGSWALDDLLQVLRNEEKDEMNMFHLLTKAAFKMSQRTSKNTEDESLSNKKGILCFSHTLTEDIMLQKRKRPAPALL